MNRIDRLTGVILLLQGQRVITAEQIAEHYEISVRTVYRDLAALGEAGVPVVAEPGVGYSLMRGYHMPPVMFTEDEAAALFLSGEVTGMVADVSLRGALRSALLKVRSVMPRERREYLDRLKEVVRVSPPGGRGGGEEDHRALMPLQQAVVRRQRVRLRYDAGGRGEHTARIVEPLGVTFYGKRWHLVAFCVLRQAFRDFRLDRMVEWEVLPEIFTGHADFSLKAFIACVFDGWDSSAVTVVFQKHVLERARHEMPGTALEERELTPEEGGGVRVEMLVFSLEWMTGWLLGFGPAMRVLHPPELRAALRRGAAAILEAHGDF